MISVHRDGNRLERPSSHAGKASVADREDAADAVPSEDSRRRPPSQTRPHDTDRQDDGDGPHAPERADGAHFNYDKYSRMVSDMELDVFFAHNPAPFIGPYPSLLSIKTGFRAMNERLFKRAKENEDLRKTEQGGRGKIKRHYLEAFDSKSPHSARFQRKVRRNIKMYAHSQAIICLFRSYFSLMEFHHRICQTYPAIRREYLKTIFMVFASAPKDAVLEMLSEISPTTRMFTFYKDLFFLWRKETDITERSLVINRV